MSKLHRDLFRCTALCRSRHDRLFSLFDASFSRRGTSNSRGRPSLVSMPRIAVAFVLHLLPSRSTVLCPLRRLFFPAARGRRVLHEWKSSVYREMNGSPHMHEDGADTYKLSKLVLHKQNPEISISAFFKMRKNFQRIIFINCYE